MMDEAMDARFYRRMAVVSMYSVRMCDAVLGPGWRQYERCEVLLSSARCLCFSLFHVRAR